MKKNRPAGPRKSNEGFRLLDLDDRLLLFLIRIRRCMPFRVLGILFGVSKSAAHNYYNEILDLIVKSALPLLVHPRSREELLAVASNKFKEDLPGALLIWDATGFRWQGRENVALSRLLYSAYHHQSEGLVLFGKELCPGALLSASNTHMRPSNRLRTEWGFCISVPNLWRHFRGGHLSFQHFNPPDGHERYRFSLLGSPPFFLNRRLAAFGIIPEEGLAPGVKIGVADSAYTRSTLDACMPLYLPGMVPEDGSAPSVRKTHQLENCTLTGPSRVRRCKTVTRCKVIEA